MQKKKISQPADLKEACVAAAHAVIAENGVEKLSLRDVARRLGVSHQAPYKHFANRDELLAEVMRRCFERFAEHLDARIHSEEPMADMSAMGQAYLKYACQNPLEYRLMFGTPWPEAAEHPDLVRDARHAFNILRKAIAVMHGSDDSAAMRKQVDLDALFVWSVLHGLASIMQSDVAGKLSLSRSVLKDAESHVFKKIGLAMHGQGHEQMRWLGNL